jgi:acyl transferase domain-containing protein
VRVPTTPTPWTTPHGVPRRAGVSSFGFSGTNSHIILEEAPPPRLGTAVARVARAQLLVLSAQTPAALRSQAAQYATFLERDGAPLFGDVAFTAAVGRSHLPERVAVVAADAASASAQLQQFLADDPAATTVAGRFTSGTGPEIAFLFSGQGAQYAGMSRELYDTEPVFRAALDACAAIVDPLLPSPLIPVIVGDADARALVDDTAFTQPALFAVEYALAQLWKSWGVVPAVVMGHSIGEYVAACLAGVFSLEDGLRLIAARGRLMSALPRDGAMVAVFAPRERVATALRGFEADVDIGAVNGPTNTVISGRAAAVDAILVALAADGVEFARLNVSHAFHSPLMVPMLDEFERIASTITFSPPSIGLVSNVTGKMAGADVATAAYWRRHVRDAVQFTDSIATLHAENIRTFLEIGPSPILVGMGQRCERASDAIWLASLRKGRSDRESMLESAGRLHVHGQPIAWPAVCDAGARRVDLPTYPFQRERYWFDTAFPPRSARTMAGTPTGHPLLGDRIASPLQLFQSSLSIATTPWLSDHRIYGNALLPGAAFIEFAMAAGREVLGSDDIAITDISLREGLTIPETGSVTVQVVVTPQEGGSQQIQVFSQSPADVNAEPAHDGPEWRLHLEAIASPSESVPPSAGIPALQADGRVDRDVVAYYDHLTAQGAMYGPGFRCITAIARSNGVVLGRMQLPAALGSDRLDYHLHPALLDSAIQMVGVGLPWADHAQDTDDVFLPVAISSYRVLRSAPVDAWCHIHELRENANRSSITTDFVLLDPDGLPVAVVEGLELHRVSRAAMQKAADKPVRPDWLLEVK